MPGRGRSDDEERYETFARVLTHDLRNPLEVATIRLETAIESDDTEHLEPALSAVRRIDEIVEGMESLLLEEGDIEREEVPLAACATDAWALVEQSGGELETVGELGTVRANRELLQELFENVFRNSLEHGRPDETETGGVRVRVEATPGGFCVADDGVGMSQEDRDRAFEAGFTTAEEGTGLGLAIVREIAAAHGWTVDLTESEAGGVRLDVETGREDRAEEAGPDTDA